MKTNYIKTSVLGAMMIYGTSAFGFNQPTPVAGGTECSNAADITAYVGHNGDKTYGSIKGDNLNPGTVGLDLQPDLAEDACWVDASAPADHSVWYSFTTTLGQKYTVTTNTGKNALDEDTQLAIWSSCSGGLLACNDDAEDDCDGANLAAATSFKGTGGTVYIQVDMYSTGQGNFTLAVFEADAGSAPFNDDVASAHDIGSLVTALSTNKMVDDGWYMFGSPCYDTLGNLDTTYAPTFESLTTYPDCANPLLSEVHDVWFTVTLGNTDDFLLSAYNKRGDVSLGIEVFNVSPTSGFPGLICSSADGLTENPNRTSLSTANDWAIGDFTNHPRVHMFGAGTYYIRVYQYPRVLVGDTTTLADACYGFFKLALENYVQPCQLVNNGVDNLDCNDSISNNPPSLTAGHLGEDVTLHFNDLCNAGMRGGISAAQGGTKLPTGRSGEPGEFQVPGGSTIEYEDCDETNGAIIAGNQAFANNNSIFYTFEVTDEVRQITLDDTLFSFTIFDSLVTFVNPVDSAETIVIPDEDLVATISVCDSLLRTRLDGIGLGDPGIGALPAPLDELCSFEATCGADIKFTFDDTKYCGVNGYTFEAFVVPYTEAGGFGTPIASYIGGSPSDACDTCFSMRSVNFFVPEGKYCLVLDGEQGNLVSTDLTMDIAYFVPGTTVSCEPLPAARKTAELFDLGIKPTMIAPVPAMEYTNVTFEVPKSGLVRYQMVDINGRVVSEGSFTATDGVNQHPFDMAQLASGMYMLNMTYDMYTTSVKLMKK